MNLVKERDSWKKNFENGEQPKSLLLVDYRRNRDSELYRTTRPIEEICEYILYLERQGEDNGYNTSCK